jgi:uncharacterized membrane protein YfcA
MLQEALALLASPYGWILYFFCSILIGISKTGVPNIGTLAIPIFAMLFGAKTSTGVVLILLCFADLVAIVYYRKSFLWSEVKKLIPMALAGLLVGLLVGKYIDDRTFRIIISLCIIFSVIIIIWTEKAASFEKVIRNKWYSPVFGFIMGFFTMIGNAAGPILSIYMLSKKLDKITFTATAAWFIMILNLTKIPLQLFVWQNLSWPGLILNILAIPFILLGGYIGIRILKTIPEQRFRQLVLSLVVLSSVMLLFS